MCGKILFTTLLKRLPKILWNWFRIQNTDRNNWVKGRKTDAETGNMWKEFHLIFVLAGIFFDFVQKLTREPFDRRSFPSFYHWCTIQIVFTLFFVDVPFFCQHLLDQPFENHLNNNNEDGVITEKWSAFLLENSKINNCSEKFHWKQFEVANTRRPPFNFMEHLLSNNIIKRMHSRTRWWNFSSTFEPDVSHIFTRTKQRDRETLTVMCTTTEIGANVVQCTESSTMGNSSDTYCMDEGRWKFNSDNGENVVSFYDLISACMRFSVPFSHTLSLSISHSDEKYRKIVLVVSVCIQQSPKFFANDMWFSSPYVWYTQIVNQTEFVPFDIYFGLVSYWSRYVCMHDVCRYTSPLIAIRGFSILASTVRLL